nr:ABC transporter ATP-binding protein [Eubacterium sp. 1001713B170207_170306_E7]
MKITGAAFAYGEQLIFEDISLETRPGEIFCLMGRNGCGKSTLLDCILGIHSLKSGSIQISGKSVDTYKPAELAREMAYLPQSHEHSFPYKVLQVVLMGRTAYMGRFGSPTQEDKAIVKKLIDKIGITHLSERPYTQLSGGELQMVMLARSLAQEAPLILMDEPTAHLDYYNELLFLETIASLVRDGQQTIFMATHSPNQAFYLENRGVPVRVGLMCGGKLVETGPPAKTLTPGNLGQVYSIEARILDSGGTKQVLPVGTLK